MRILKWALASFLVLFFHQALAGEFGNYRSTGLANGELIQTDCSIKTDFESKTYCFGNERPKVFS